MSANTQTLAGPASEPSASRADTTSASAGRKRKTPVRPSELASNGGDGWTLDLERQLWTARWQEGTSKSYREIGDIIGRSPAACRGRLCQLRKKYEVQGYEETFRQQRPAGLEEPPAKKIEGADLSGAGKGRMTTEEQAAADSAERSALVSPEAEDHAWEAEAARLAREKPAAAEPNEEETFRLGLERIEDASHRLEGRARRRRRVQPEAGDDESAANPIFDAARWRTAHGLRWNTVAPAAAIETNKTTEYADPKTQAAVGLLELHRGMHQRYFDPVPTQETLDDVGVLLKEADSDGARLSPDAQSAAKRRTPQDPRQSVDCLMN